MSELIDLLPPPDFVTQHPDTLAGDSIPYNHDLTYDQQERDNHLGESRAAQALVAFSNEVHSSEYNPLIDDPNKRLKVVVVERDEAGNVISIKKGPRTLVGFEKRIVNDAGEVYPDGSPKWAIDDTVDRVDPESIGNFIADDRPDLLPHVDESDRGKSIVTEEAVKAHESSFMHVPNFKNSVAYFRRVAGRVIPGKFQISEDGKTGTPVRNDRIYVSRRTKSELLYGDPLSPKKKEWGLSEEEVYEVLIEELRYDPQIPISMNYAEAEAARPYRVDRNGNMLPQIGEVGADEIDPQIDIDKFMEHFPKGTSRAEMADGLIKLREEARNHLLKQAFEPGYIGDPDIVKYLKFEKETEQAGPNDNTVAWAARIYNYADKRIIAGGFDDMETAMLNEMDKRIKTTTGTGPDHDYRMMFAYRNSNGVLVWPDTNKPLTHFEERVLKDKYKELMNNGHDLAKMQAEIAYEITKQKPYMQALLWQRALNLQSELGFTLEQVGAIMIGIQYANKPLYLSLKHRYMVNPLVRDKKGRVVFEDHIDENGKPVMVTKVDRRGRTIIDPATGSPVLVQERVPKLDKKRIVVGHIKFRDYITELRHRFPQYKMNFESPEVKSMIDISLSTIEEMDEDFYENGFVKGRGINKFNMSRKNKGRLSQQYLDNLYGLTGLADVAASLMAIQTSDKHGAAELLQQQNDLATRQMGEYAPRISSGATPNQLAGTFYKIIMAGKRRYPSTGNQNLPGYGRWSQLDRKPGEIY